MDIEVFSFPTVGSDGIAAVESQYCELLNKYRNGECLDPEKIDWMDYANNVLSTTN